VIDVAPVHAIVVHKTINYKQYLATVGTILAGLGVSIRWINRQYRNSIHNMIGHQLTPAVDRLTEALTGLGDRVARIEGYNAGRADQRAEDEKENHV
jgi:hypothetical protein